MDGIPFRGAHVRDHVCLGVCVNQDLIDRKIKAHISEPPFFQEQPSWRSLVSSACPKFGVLRSRLAQAPCWACAVWDGSYLLDIHYQTLFVPFICSLSAALNINYRGTLQLDISSFTLYLKQHAATSKSCSCLWCCKKKELQWSTKNQCNFLEPCFIHLLSLEVWSQSLEVQTAPLWCGKDDLCSQNKVKQQPVNRGSTGTFYVAMMGFVFSELHFLLWLSYLMKSKGTLSSSFNVCVKWHRQTPITVDYFSQKMGQHVPLIILMHALMDENEKHDCHRLHWVRFPILPLQ